MLRMMAEIVKLCRTYSHSFLPPYTSLVLPSSPQLQDFGGPGVRSKGELNSFLVSWHTCGRVKSIKVIIV